MSTRKKVLSPKAMSDELKKHSPLKKGLVVKNEDKPYENVSKIMNRIYLGNIHAAKDKEFMKKHKIKAVLNCSKEKDIPNFYCESSIEYMRVPVDDSLKQTDFDKMYKLLPSAVEYIAKHADILKQNILIHCWAGKQRSVICVAAYLVAKHGLTPDEACKYILKKRPEAFHYGLSLNFDQTLIKYYKDLQKKK
jgi:protein-tyrosine phosphatase